MAAPVRRRLRLQTLPLRHLGRTQRPALRRRLTGLFLFLFLFLFLICFVLATAIWRRLLSPSSGGAGN